MSLDQDSITFGKYKGKSLNDILKDRQYCKWLMKDEQSWFKNYSHLYNQVKEYNPLSYFVSKSDIQSESDFLQSYIYFNLLPLEEVTLPLSDNEKICYSFYLETISILYQRVLDRIDADEENPYDIKAVNGWLRVFERKHNPLTRQIFKEFMSAYDLPNITYIIEDIKREGGIEYKGAQSFKIAKARSLQQEKYWEDILKDRYGDDISVQFKYGECIFDFLNIKTQTIFEAKLNITDFNDDQHVKYKLVLSKYRIVYLIGRDAVIWLEKGCIITTDPDKYHQYIYKIGTLHKTTYLDELITDFDVVEVDDIKSVFNATTM